MYAKKFPSLTHMIHISEVFQKLLVQNDCHQSSSLYFKHLIKMVKIQENVNKFVKKNYRTY